MSLKSQLIQEIEQLLDMKGGFLAKLSKNDLQILQQAIVKSNNVQPTVPQPDALYSWGIIWTECGGFKSSVGRSRGVSMKIARGTTLPAFALMYSRLQMMTALGGFDDENYESSIGKGKIENYDMTHYGIAGFPDSDPAFWCEMQVSGLGDNEFYLLPKLPQKAYVRASRAFQDAHSVSSAQLDRLLPPLVTSRETVWALQELEYQRYQCIVDNIDSLGGIFYEIAGNVSFKGYQALEDILTEINERIMPMLLQPQSIAKVTPPKALQELFKWDDKAVEELTELLLKIQSACARPS